jgi:uncharacterized protein YuzE
MRNKMPSEDDLDTAHPARQPCDRHHRLSALAKAPGPPPKSLMRLFSPGEAHRGFERRSRYADARDRRGALVVDLDANGDVVGFDIDQASRKLDLSKIETIALPPATAAE